MIEIAPSLLAANFASLGQEVQRIEQEADWLHIDIMDGHFVPNISFGAPVVKAVQSVTALPLDVHLMISEPDKYIAQFADLGAKLITVHAEACVHLHRTIQQIKALGCMAGVALNPHTSPENLRYILSELDYVLVMTVNPGFGGQSFIAEMLPKIKAIKTMAAEQSCAKLRLAVDGGINMHTAPAVIGAGANFLVAGSAVFKALDPIAAIKQLKDLV